MRILFLSPRQCWPARSGAKLREYYFVRSLAQLGELTHVHFTDPGSEPLTRHDLPFCHEVVAIPKPSAYGPRKLLQGALGRWPVSVLNYTSPEMCATVERLTKSAAYDLLHLDSIHMQRYADVSGVPKVVYNWHNIESEIMRRYAETISSPARAWYARLTAQKLGALEQEILETGFGHIVCSDRERDQLHRIAPRARVAVVENGVESAGFPDSPDAPWNGKIVFVGLMDYHPNVEAATSFARNIWPVLRRRLPELSLWIVGANPIPAVTALRALPGVSVTGTVPDVRPYYRDAAAAIVPLRSGGGTRLKILEAMAAGVPVISTPLGAEGLDVTPGEHLLLAEPDDAGEWARHLTFLAQDPARRKKLIQAARHLVRTRYDWQALGSKLRETYQGWLRSEA